MITHFLKMVWNRKRVNGLIMIEIFVSFLVLFFVLTAAAYYISNYYKPLGYSIDGVWNVQVNSRLPMKGYEQVRSEGLIHLTLAMKDLPEVESVGWMYAPPYARSTWTNGRTFQGQDIFIEINRASDDVQRVLNMPLVAGRWFSKEDDGAKLTPVVINEEYARLIYGDQDPVGKLPLDSTCRIVGVMKDFRKGGEFSGPILYQISRLKFEDTTVIRSGSFIIHVRPGTTAAFQGKLISVLESVEKGWSFNIETLANSRESDFKLRLAPLIVGGVVALFLLLMVALGLIGVLWQNVSQRTNELGLRRALGGTAQHLSWQIRGEQFIITSIGVAAGSLIAMQLPLINLIDFIRPETYVFALVVSLVIMYGLTYFCSMFPAWMAMDIQPAEALHYE